MSKRSDLVYLGVLLDARSKVEHVTKAEFDADDTLQLALTYLVQNVGEAASRVPAALRATAPQIEIEPLTPPGSPAA